MTHLITENGLLYMYSYNGEDTKLHFTAAIDAIFERSRT